MATARVTTAACRRSPPLRFASKDKQRESKTGWTFFLEAEQRHDPLEETQLSPRHDGALQHTRVQPPAWHRDAVQKPQLIDRKACSREFGAQFLRVVAPEVIEVLVERAIQRLDRRHEQHEVSAGRQHTGKV